MPRGYIAPEINVLNTPAPLIVGRDPGDEDVSRGRPMMGSSGSVFFGGYDPSSNSMIQGSLAHAGLTRDMVNITHRVPKHPWNNDFFRHSWEDINSGLRDLRSLIAELKPSIIVACGPHAAYDLVPEWATLTDKKPGEYSGGKSIKSAKEILDRRGFLWYPEDGTGLPCPVLVTIHPASCVYQTMPNRLLLDIDMQRLGAVLRGELPRRTFPKPQRVRYKADLEKIWQADLVAYDIEVKWGGSEFLCIALYTSDGDAFLAYADGLGAVEEWLRSDRPKVTHNGQFDRYFLETKCGIPVGGHHEDTICAHWAAYPELAGRADTGREDGRKKKKSQLTRKGLNFLASFHLNYPWWKTYTSDPDQMGQLCVNDVVATLDSWRIYNKEMDDLGVRPQYERQIAKLPALISVQKRGMLIDEDMRRTRMRALLSRQRTLEAESKAAAESFLKEYSLKSPFWYKDARCECCFGGDLKRAHCTSCAGVVGTGSGGSIKKSDLILPLWRAGHDPDHLKGLTKGDLMDMFPPCQACGGVGTLPRWDFNPMSGSQLIELLWTHLNVPKGLYSGATPNAQEDP